MDMPTLKAPTARKLLAWYDRNRRDLPWRAKPGEHIDPYRVWLSEIMLQQTTVVTVAPYFERFLSLWPTVEALSSATEEAVLNEWAGLGYYSRARNLKRCADAVVSEFGGRFPATAAELWELPGIGPYTAAAIAAIAFGEQVAVVDGNVERVMTRLFRVKTPLPKAKREITAHTAALTPKGRPGDFAQGLMDLGAIICKPRAPLCDACPWAASCQAKLFGDMEAFPKKLAKKPKPKKQADILYLRDAKGRVLVRQRPETGLLAQMWELPSSPWDETDLPEGRPAFDLADIIISRSRPNLLCLGKEVTHTFTHFHQRFRIWVGEVSGKVTAKEGAFLGDNERATKPFPTLMTKVFEAVEFSKGQAP